MKTIRNLLSAAVLFVSLNVLHAQTTTTDSIVKITAEAEGLSQVPLESVPIMGGTFWVVSQNGVIPPFPGLPVNLFNSPIYDMGDGTSFLVDATAGQVIGSVDALGNSVANLIEQTQTTQMLRDTAMMFGMDVPTPGDGGGSGGDYTNYFSSSFSIDTNLLWIEITNVSNGFSYYNLHNATNFVYAIEATTDLPQSFGIVAELFPADTNCQPFTLQNNGQPILFVRAMDWSGVDSDSDGVPDWWAWKYFGIISLTDTNLDYSGNGNTFAQDYTNGIVPTVFSFSGIEVTNNYVNISSANARLIVAGTPYYMAISVDDTNYQGDAVWQNYSGSNVTVNLGLTEGWHDVWIGLRGHGDASTNTVWQNQRIKLDWTPPALVITSPTNSLITQPMIQLKGYSPEELRTINYDITNAAGLVVSQSVVVTSQFADTNTWEFTTNYFQGFDIPLTNGLNIISLHATDLAGNVTTTNLSLTVDYSSITNPPAVEIIWPQSGSMISGTSFTLDGKLTDPTASVSVSTVDTNGGTNSVSGMVGRDGKFLVKQIPLGAGTNSLTLLVADAAGNMTTTNIFVIQTAITLTMDDVTPDSQLWQPTVNVTGKISETTYAVWVNGVKGHNNGDGTWSASNVPTTQDGTTSFTIVGYSPSEQQPDGSYGN